jgi:hypothetical protein
LKRVVLDMLGDGLEIMIFVLGTVVRVPQNEQLL